MTTPIVSVTIAVFNGERYLREALDSVLGQTFDDFEIIVIDDGSTDSTAALLEEFASMDSRVQVIRQENQGLTKSLNRAIGIARGRYIARMDADDVCLPERFALQVGFLERHPDVVAVGASTHSIDVEGRITGTRIVATDCQEIDDALLSGNTAIAHPSVMIRSSILKQVGGYSEEYQTAQDLDLFLRLSEVGRVTNLPEVLLHYRWHDENVSVRKATQQDRDVAAILAAARNRRGLPSNPGIPDSRWQYRRVMARKYALSGNRRGAIRFASQAITLKPFSLRSWYTLFVAITLSPSASRSNKQP